MPRAKVVQLRLALEKNLTRLTKLLPVFILIFSIHVTGSQALNLNGVLQEAQHCAASKQSKRLLTRIGRSRVVEKTIRDVRVLSNALACQKRFGGYNSLIRKYSASLKKNQKQLRSPKLCKYFRHIANMRPKPTRVLAGYIKKLPTREGKRLCRSWISRAKRNY